jgi:hypothetical protein
MRFLFLCSLLRGRRLSVAAEHLCGDRLDPRRHFGRSRDLRYALGLCIDRWKLMSWTIGQIMNWASVRPPAAVTVCGSDNTDRNPSLAHINVHIESSEGLSAPTPLHKQGGLAYVAGHGTSMAESTSRNGQ